jgi:hypothetical protein
MLPVGFLVVYVPFVNLQTNNLLNIKAITASKRQQGRSPICKPLCASLNHDKTEKAENPLKSRQLIKTIIYEKVCF